MKEFFQAIFISAAMLAVLLSISGCLDMYTARTIATYRVTTTAPDGTVVVKEMAYNSNKTQDGLELDVKEENGMPIAVLIKVDKASTPEAIAAGLLKMQTELSAKLADIALKAAAMGAAS